MIRPRRSDVEDRFKIAVNSRWFPVALIVGCTTFAAVAEPGSTETAIGAVLLLSNNPHIQPYARVMEKARWPNSTIFVCWEKSAIPYAKERKIVELAVSQTWQQESMLVFSGWGFCGEENKGIRIGVADIQPITQVLGVELNKLPNGIIFNFTFKMFPLPCDDGERDACIRVIAVHEFGHALGFTHEEWQPRAPEKCLLARYGPSGDRSLTPYDTESVMNGCNPKYGNKGQLSVLDRQALHEFYDVRKPGS